MGFFRRLDTLCAASPVCGSDSGCGVIGFGCPGGVPLVGPLPVEGDICNTEAAGSIQTELVPPGGTCSIDLGEDAAIPRAGICPTWKPQEKQISDPSLSGLLQSGHLTGWLGWLSQVSVCMLL